MMKSNAQFLDSTRGIKNDLGAMLRSIIVSFIIMLPVPFHQKLKILHDHLKLNDLHDLKIVQLSAKLHLQIISPNLLLS